MTLTIGHIPVAARQLVRTKPETAGRNDFLEHRFGQEQIRARKEIAPDDRVFFRGQATSPQHLRKHGIDGRIIEDAAFTVIGAFDESQFAHRKSELAFVQLSLPELTDEFTGQ